MAKEKLRKDATYKEYMEWVMDASEKEFEKEFLNLKNDNFYVNELIESIKNDKLLWIELCSIMETDFNLEVKKAIPIILKLCKEKGRPSKPEGLKLQTKPTAKYFVLILTPGGKQE